MGEGQGITLQVGLAPTDAVLASELLPHQIRQLGPSVDEVVLLVDSRRPPRDLAARAQASRPELDRVFSRLAANDPRIVVHTFRDGAEEEQEIGAAYLGGRRAPARDYRGRPWHGYLLGLERSSNDLVFHVDADILLGGGSHDWLAEARALLDGDPSILACSPLPGPPRDDGALLRQQFVPEPGLERGYAFSTFSWRVFAMRRSRLRAIAPLPVLRPPPRNWITAARYRCPPVGLVELAISQRMASLGMRRVDFQGSAPGMWSLHLDDRRPALARLLPELVRRVEAGDVPSSQRGDYDVGPELLRICEAASQE